MATDGYRFWVRVDELNPYRSLAELASAEGLDYENIKQQRKDTRLPKTLDVLKLAKALDTTAEFLVTGEKQRKYSARVEDIAWHCQNEASPEDLVLIERILGIESGYMLVARKKEASGIAAGLGGRNIG